MRIERNRLYVIAASAIALWTLTPGTARAATLCVAPGGANGCSSSIQAAVAAAQSGDAIAVQPGEYIENVVIDKSLTIFGTERDDVVLRPAVSNANPCSGSSLCSGLASNIILVQASDVTIHDLTLDGDNPYVTSGIVRGGADLDARNGIIANYLAGIFNNLTVYNVTVRNIYLRGIYASSGGTFQFHHNRVDNVQGDYYSIGVFNFGGSGTMAFNHVSRANDAISSNWSTGVQFLNNIVVDSASGIHTDNSSGGDLIAGNRVTQGNPLTSGSPTYGIWTFVPYKSVMVRNNEVDTVDVALASFGQAGGLSVPAATAFEDNVVKGRSDAIGAFVTTDELGYGSNSVVASFAGNAVSGLSDGVILQSDPGNTISVTLTCNDIRKITRGVTAMGAYDPHVAGSQNVSLHLNNIETKGVGVSNEAVGTIDAQRNWWGCAAGPGVPGCSAVSGDVDFRFWLERPSQCAHTQHDGHGDHEDQPHND